MHQLLLGFDGFEIDLDHLYDSNFGPFQKQKYLSSGFF